MKEPKYRLPEPQKVGDFYPEAKVYYDGSHYIAIPHTTKPYKPRPKKKEEIITVKPQTADESSESCLSRFSINFNIYFGIGLISFSVMSSPHASVI